MSHGQLASVPNPRAGHELLRVISIHRTLLGRLRSGTAASGSPPKDPDPDTWVTPDGKLMARHMISQIQLYLQEEPGFLGVMRLGHRIGAAPPVRMGPQRRSCLVSPAERDSVTDCLL